MSLSKLVEIGSRWKQTSTDFLFEIYFLSVFMLHDDMLARPPQVQAGPLPDCGASLHQDSAKQAEPPQTEAPAKVSDL